MIFFSRFDLVKLFLRKTNASFYIRGLECSGFQRVFDGGLGEKVLFTAGRNRICCVHLVKFKDRRSRVSCVYCFG